MFSCIDRIKIYRKKRVVKKNRTFPMQADGGHAVEMGCTRRIHSLSALELLKSPAKPKINKEENKKVEEMSNNPRKPFPAAEKTLHVCRNVLKKLLSPKKATKLNEVEGIKRMDVGQPLPTSPSKELGCERTSSYSSLSSLIISTGNFCTSSPVFQQKNPRRGQDDPSNDSIINGMSPSGVKATLNFSDIDNEKDEEKVSLKGSSRCRGNLINSKSESELFPLLEFDREIMEMSNDNGRRHSYPGMSNTTRRESWQELLKCIISNMKNESEASSSSSYALGSFSEDSLEVPTITRKPMREALLEISRRRSFYVSRSPQEDDYHPNLFDDDFAEEIKELPAEQSQSLEVLYKSYSCLEENIAFNNSQPFIITMYV
uniref:Dgk_0 protein n=1 Tax=Fopius arisanus TaxID=64838 RepID=A0A0C9PYA5_9HYME